MTESISIICSIDEYDVTGSCYEETQAAQEQAISTVPLESSTIGSCGGRPEEKQTNSIHAINPETIVSEQGPKEAKESSYEKWKRRRIISLYLLTISILFADMNLLAPNLSTIADEFGFDDDERDVKLGGLIALGFFFVGAPVSFVVGWLADSMNRSPLYSATVFVGEIGCLMTAFVKTYPALYACRVLTGISIGGAIPVIYSVLGDLYPANQRAGIAAVVTTGTGLGMGIGQVIAGSLDDWRLPFIVVSIPGLICSMLLLFVQDPRRGEKEQAFLEKRNQIINADSTLTDGEDIVVPVVRSNHFESLENCGMDCPTSNFTSCLDTVQRISRIQNDAPELNNTRDAPRRSIKSSHCVSCQSTKEILKIPSVLLTILQAAPGALPFGFCATFLNDFLQEQRGMTKQQATGVLLTFGAGNAVGVILGGLLGHFSYKRDVRGPPFFMGVSLILGCIPFYFLVNAVDENGNVGIASAITIISGILVVIPVPLERSILTNVCLPQSRGRANALVSIVDDLGKGLGPALVSVLITTFDRQTAFNISLIGWIIGGLLSLAIMLFVGNDEESVQQTLRIQLSGNQDGE